MAPKTGRRGISRDGDLSAWVSCGQLSQGIDVKAVLPNISGVSTALHLVAVSAAIIISCCHEIRGKTSDSGYFTEAPGGYLPFVYVYPARLRNDGFTGVPRFRKNYDLYNLGVVLLEIAFWEPILAFTSPKDRKEIESFVVRVNESTAWRRAMHAAAEQELGPEMGAPYRDAVLFCIKGPRLKDRDKEGIEADDLKNMDLGVERDFTGEW